MWRDFHIYWFSKNPGIPVYFVRFEDLLDKPYECLLGVFAFLLGVSSPQKLVGTEIDKRIRKAAGEPRPEVYKPRCGKINANIGKFNESQIAYIIEESEDIIHKLGYS